MHQDENFYQTLINDNQECPVAYAFENYQVCMETLRELLQVYRMDE